MKWDKKKVLVTGAGGFIGSHLTEKLVKSGARVRAFIRYNSRGDKGMLELFSPEVRDSIEIVPGDLKDPEAVHKAAEKMEYIFHLGALIAIPYSYVHPGEVVETNVLGTLNVLNAARACGAKKVVHTSTSEVYGTARYVPIDEKHPLQGQSPYSASKIAADKIAESYHRAFGLNVATIRPFNTYGPRQSARAVIPTIISQIISRDKIYLGNLSPTRDFTYVADMVEAFLKMAESPKSGGETVNFGSGKEISVRELVKKISAILGREARIVTDSRRVRPEKSEVDRLCADTKKAGKLLGWKPAVPLEEGLEMTIGWIKENLGKFRPGTYQL